VHRLRHGRPRERDGDVRNVGSSERAAGGEASGRGQTAQ